MEKMWPDASPTFAEPAEGRRSDVSRQPSGVKSRHTVTTRRNIRVFAHSTRHTSRHEPSQPAAGQWGRSVVRVRLVSRRGLGRNAKRSPISNSLLRRSALGTRRGSLAELSHLRVLELGKLASTTGLFWSGPGVEFSRFGRFSERGFPRSCVPG